MTKKAWQFTALAYLISWTVALLLYLAGIQYGSIVHTALIALFYMTGPAVAAIIVQNIIYRQSLADYGLRFKQTSIKYVIFSFLAIWLIILLTLGLIYLFGNVLQLPSFGQIDFSATSVVQQLTELANQRTNGAVGEPTSPLPFSPALLFLLMLLQGSILGAIFNFPFAFGEELGWRGLLVKETESLGFVKSSLVIGLIWGLWHAPIILQGHNYPGYTIVGIGMMTLFTITLSFLLTYLRQQSKSLIAPTVFHGAINAVAPGLAIFIVGENLLFGSVAGIAGIIAIAITALLFIKSDRHFKPLD